MYFYNNDRIGRVEVEDRPMTYQTNRPLEQQSDYQPNRSAQPQRHATTPNQHLQTSEIQLNRDSLTPFHFTETPIATPSSSVSSTRAILDSPNTLSTIKNKATAVFRRLSLKEPKPTAAVSDAETFKHQVQMCLHPASVVSQQPRLFMNPQAVEFGRRVGTQVAESVLPYTPTHVRYTGVSIENARIPGIYVLNQEDKVDRLHEIPPVETKRRGSIQQIMGKVFNPNKTKNINVT